MESERVNLRALFISFLLFGITMYVVYLALIESHPYNGFAAMTGLMAGMAVGFGSYELLLKALAKANRPD